MAKRKTHTDKKIFSRRFRLLFSELGQTIPEFLSNLRNAIPEEVLERGRTGCESNNTITRWKSGESFPKPHHLNALKAVLVEAGWRKCKTLDVVVNELVDSSADSQDWEKKLMSCTPDAKPTPVSFFLTHRVVSISSAMGEKADLVEMVLDSSGFSKDDEREAFRKVLYRMDDESLRRAAKLGPCKIQDAHGVE